MNDTEGASRAEQAISHNLTSLQVTRDLTLKVQTHKKLASKEALSAAQSMNTYPFSAHLPEPILRPVQRYWL